MTGAYAYAELRSQIVAAGLLRRAYGYYLWRTAMSFAFLCAGPCLAFLLPSGPLSMVLAAVVLAFGSVQVALIGHDAGHQAVFSTRRANYVLGWICWTLALGISFWYWADRHNRHHARTNEVSADPDLSWLFGKQTLLGPTYAFGLAFSFRTEGWGFALHRLRGAQRALELTLLALWPVVWLLPAVAIGWWWCPSLLLGQMLAGAYLAAVVAPNHKGMPIWSTVNAPRTFLERQVLSSRNIKPHPVANFVFGGLNYQIEHHLFPTIPRSHLHAARRLVRAHCQLRGLAYEEVDVLTSYAMVLSELRRVAKNASEKRRLVAASASATNPTVK